MVDEQPRWPAGTPSTPHGPGGGRWMKVKASDLPSILTGALHVLRQPYIPYALGEMSLVDHAEPSGPGAVKVTRGGHQSGAAMPHPDHEVEIMPVESDPWFSHLAARVTGTLPPHGTTEQASPDAQLGTPAEVIEHVRQGHAVQVHWGDRWQDVTRVHVHSSGMERSAVEVGMQYLSPSVFQYRTVEGGHPGRVIDYGQQAFPGQPDGPDRRREEAMYALGAATRHHQLQVQALLAHYGLGHDEADVRDALSTPRAAEYRGLNFNVDWDEAGAILDAHLAKLLLSDRIDLKAVVKIYQQAKAGRQEEQAVARELEIGVISADAQHMAVAQALKWAVEKGLLDQGDAADAEASYYDFYEPIDWLSSYQGGSKGWQRRLWESTQEAMGEFDDGEEDY